MPLTYRTRALLVPRVHIGPLGLIYLIVGAIVASTHHYYAHLDTARAIGSAVLAILLWPLLFLGINLHIR